MMVWADTQNGPVTVTVPDRAALLADIGARFDRGDGFSVATINLDHVVKLARDPAFRDAYGAHSHVTADGNPIVWLSHLAGQGDVALVPGSEVIEPVAELAAAKGIPVAFFGATETSLKAAAEAMQTKTPGINIVLTLAPAMGFDPDGPAADAAIAQIGESGARLVFLALGAPKQERFAVRAAAALPGTGYLSIGAGLDFISGAQVRAPAWVRAIAAEWLWRMLSNPRRLAARYGACILALPRLTLRALAARRKGAMS
ncbi:MAG: WecB/TagA/CpsF family glycosyltransferase [Pseudomonadota bacterium]